VNRRGGVLLSHRRATGAGGAGGDAEYARREAINMAAGTWYKPTRPNMGALDAGTLGWDGTPSSTARSRCAAPTSGCRT
jgi:hypothetical protein